MDTFLETATSERGLNEDSHKVQDQKSKEELREHKKLVQVLIPSSVSDPEYLYLHLHYEDHSIHTRHDVDRYMFPKVVQDNAKPNISNELLENARIISQELTLGSQGAPSHRVFSMEELEEATKKFNISALLGEGSIGKLLL
ncbi:hypothetical protein T459_01999 [Capsicum annuum]|uniref:Uncharacterized protein n=1 Tax=Capsicum annuum TaxID=4072 RepID=A0A2G3AIP9_CAPAN|nr:hypothetical protein T459_01999 [Capsicum annuum]